MLTQAAVTQIARQFQVDPDVLDERYEELFDYYSNNGDMPYGAAKARTEDPFQWIATQLNKEV